MSVIPIGKNIPRRLISVRVDEEIAEEFATQLSNFVEDFYGEEASKIEITVEDPPKEPWPSQ